LDETRHAPVMLDEAMTLLRPRSGGLYCDATLGGGGHAERLLQLSAPDGRLVGIDRDADALERVQRRLRPFGDRVRLVHGNYADAARLLGDLGCVPVDGFLLDLGLSSDQIEDAGRGFSFSRGGPLDMRFDRSRPGTAADLLRCLDVDDLARLLAEWGEQPAAARVARAIRREIDEGRLDSTAALAAVVTRAVPGARRGRTHPATRVFQALRIAVNDELGALAAFLRVFAELLSPGGRVVVIAFHSLEDRLVKQRLRELSARSATGPVLALLTRRPLSPGAAERAANPRARSARLRAAERVRPEVSA
jgi:16S rRNA (cytosine1402-N4)-methyltransferase